VQWQNRVFENLSTQWVNQASVRKEDLFALKIPLPPLPEQRRIAALLAKADRLRRLRRYARQLGDTYLQSVFLEMFGESLEGKTDIPLVVLEGVCTKITDGTHITPEYIESGVPFVSIKDLTKTPGQIDFSDVKYISREEHEKISRLSSVERNDILYTKVGSYGIAQIVDTDREFSIFVSVALLKPDNTKILPKFLEIVLKSDFVKRQADRLVSGIGVPDLHLREIKTFRIPLPSKPVQQIFVEVARRYDRLRKQQRESARQAEMLFQSLLKSAFEGNI
jgi:type I restriction enzyme S subunit